MEKSSLAFDSDDLHLSLGLPGRERDESEQPSSSYSSSQAKNTNNKRSSSQLQIDDSAAPPPKAPVVGWPPVKRNAAAQMYVKVSMDGAPYLRKIDLKFYRNYSDLLVALEGMFKCSLGVYSEREGFKGSEFRPTYEDKDGDWMLAGDVPWEMFITSCKRLRIMKGSDDKGSN